MFTPNPGVFAAGVEVLTPYQNYQAYIRTRGAVVPWAINVSHSAQNALVSSVSATLGGVMAGSCWSGRVFRSTASPCRVAQHAFPSLAALTAVAGTDILIASTYVGDGTAASSYNRNGYASLALASDEGASRCTEVLYWQDDQAWKINPFAGAAPVTFVVP